MCLANSASRVYSLDISSPGDDFAALQKKNPEKFAYIQVDVTSEESVANAIEKIVEGSGRFDGMIANAGMTKHQPALEFSMAQVEQLFKLNVSQNTVWVERSTNQTGFWGVELCHSSSKNVHQAQDQGIHCVHSINDFLQTKPRGTFSTIWWYQGSCSQHDPYPGHGMGRAWY